MNFSIVIPTWNRSELVEALLESLYVERERYQQGETEVLIVDSSSGNEQDRIKTACMKFNATYIEGDDSVRKKETKESSFLHTIISCSLIQMLQLKKDCWMNM